MVFVRKIFTDSITDGIRLSEYWSSVIPIPVATSIRKKKHRQSYKRTKRAKKIFHARTLLTEFFRLYFHRYITDGQSAGDCGMDTKYFRTLCKILTNKVRQYPLVLSTVNHRWNNAFDDCGMGSKFFSTLCLIPTDLFCL